MEDHHHHEDKEYGKEGRYATPEKVAHAGNGDHSMHDHNAHHRMMIADFKNRFWVSMVLTVPVLLLAPMIQEWLGVAWRFTGDRYVAFGLSSIMYFRLVLCCL